MARWLTDHKLMPLPWADALVRRFHQPSSAVLVSSPALLRRLQEQAWDHLHDWTTGVDTRLFHARIRLLYRIKGIERRDSA